MSHTRPTVKLRPGRGRRLSEGAPWVYADELALDRRTRALAPGSLARLEGRDGAIGLVAVNPLSQIAARLLDPNPDAEIGEAWFARKLVAARTLREAFCGTPHYRLIHAEGDGLPGLVIDRFADAVVIQPNAAWIEPQIDALLAALDHALSPAPETVVLNASSRARALEGLESRIAVIRGGIVGPLAVPMNGAIYMADLLEGQKTGLFYDQRETHARAARLAPGRRVLDLFTHVGGFALACLASGAEHAVAVDSSGPALALARQGAERTGVAQRFETRQADAQDAMRDALDRGERYGLVISDPPAFAPHKGALDAGLGAYERTARRAAQLVEPGGWLVLCSCSGAVSPEAFRGACVSGIRGAGRSGALVATGRAGPDHPQHMALPETGYLKALFFRLDP